MKIHAIYFITLILLSIPDAKADTLQPFSSDGCSLFPDGTFENKNLWCKCCFQHDVAYWQGGTKQQRLKADLQLRQCILSTTADPWLANLMYAGVRTGGSAFYPTWYRWGYGWPYGRGYWPLSIAEQQQVDYLYERYAHSGSPYICLEE